METNGWIKEYNKKLDWEWFRTPNVAHFFDYCLLKMNKKDIEWRGITIKKGQFVTSREVASVETGLTIQQVRTCINKLKSTNEITIETTNKYTIITICNIDKYQNFCELCNQENNQNFNQQITNKQPTNNQQITTSKDNIDIIDIKNNKEKETLRVSKKKDELSFSDQETPSTSNLFEQDSTVQETNVDVNVYKEKELNEKKKKSANDEYKCLAQQVVDIWNSECTTLPKVSKLTPARKTKIIQRLKEFGNPNDCLTTYNDIITKINKSDFLLGNKTDWKITFDWLFVNSTNWLKISEGVYDNKDNINTNTPNTTKKYPDYVYELPPAEKKRRQLMGIS